MKKRYLLLMAALTANAAMAQQQHSVVFTQPRQDVVQIAEPAPPPVGVRKSGTANKGTALQQGWFSVVDALFTSTSRGVRQFTYDDSTVVGVYSNGNFHIRYHGWGYSLDPTSKIFSEDFQDINAIPGFAVKPTDAYTLDSIAVLGQYRRNNPQYTDTLFVEIAAVHANSPGAWQLINKNAVWAPQSPDSTIRFADATYDWTRNRISDSVTGRVRLIKVLNSAAHADSSANGTHTFTLALPQPLNVPAGGKVVVYTHFKSSHVYPFGTLSTAANTWLHNVYEINGQSTLPTQRRGDYNCGLFSDNDDRYHTGTWTSYSGHAILTPTYYYTAPAQFDDPYFQFYLKCNTCAPLGVKNVSNVSAVSAFPNPAANTLSVSLKLKSEGNINVTISNMMGQVVKAENLGRAAAGVAKTATFDVSDLAAGVYLYTVESNGQRTTNRVVVAH